MNWLEDCLSSVDRSIYPLNLIIIDNCSTDETVSFINENYNSPHIQFIESKVNLGFGGANNLGIQIAVEKGAKYVFLLNQDTRIYPETISKTLKVFDFDDKIGIASPFHLNDDGSSLDYNFEIYLKHTKGNYISDVTLNSLKEFYEVYFTNAAAWIIKTEVIKKIGLFSDLFFHYGEDINLIHRLQFFGFKCVVVPSAYIHHCREERKGKFNFDFEKKRILINTQVELLNINQSYFVSYLKVINLAIKELFQKNFYVGCSIILFSISNYFKFKKARKLFVV